MIRETYFDSKNFDGNQSIAKNPLLQLLFLSMLFIISASCASCFSGYSFHDIAGIAGVLTFPSGLYHVVKGANKDAAERSAKTEAKPHFSDMR